MSNPNVNEQGYIYGKFQTGPKTWTIMSRNAPQFTYVLIGDEKAALIDSFYGYGDFRAFVETITDKPLMVISTHGHYDHTGGNAFWEEAYMSEISTHDCKEAFGEEMKAMLAAMPYPDYKTNVLKEGDVIDLGNHKLEILEIGAHHEGSIAILDLTERIAYTGDEMEAGQVMLDFLDLEKVKKHLANMKKLKAREADFDFIGSAHNGTHLTKDYLDDFITLDEQILAGTASVSDDTNGFGMGQMPGAKRASYGRAHFVGGFHFDPEE